MRALIYSFLEKKFKIESQPIPSVKNGELLIKIINSALCGTDLHIISGVLKSKVYNNKKITLGHAWSGVVVKKGAGVKKFSIGDLVFGNDFFFCGKCKKCNDEKENLCKNFKVFGMGAKGTHSDYAVFPERITKKIPRGINEETACFMADLVATAIHAVRKHVPQKNDCVGIYGGGPLGIVIGVILKRIFGVKNIYLFEPSRYRLKLAKKILNPKIFPKNKFASKFFDVIYEVSGSQKALKSTFTFLKKDGTVILVGVYDKDAPIPVTKIITREIKILGSLAYTFKDLKRAMEITKQIQSDIKKLITHKMTLENGQKAYDLIKKRKAGLIIFKINKQK
ncbi:MAG: alcohol dehydrogenase catalytic domain-containing protein [Candidatus Paceibacterota bacterium]|jgi:2-desacetyl-2-hydroxyethyl bacteriochlorophyllide A dehydrogenase